MLNQTACPFSESELIGDAPHRHLVPIFIPEPG